MYKFVLFDMDGTVLNTLTDIHIAVNHTLRHFGYPEQSVKQVMRNTGNASRNLITKSCPEGADIEAALEFYLPYYQANCDNNTKPYDGIVELMQRLKERGIKMAIVSNKMDEAVKNLSSRWFPSLVDVAVGECDGLKRKPAPDLVEKALKELGATYGDTVYVGDTEVDIATSSNSNLPCIAVTWGFREKEDIIGLGADVYCDTCDEVFEAIIGQQI